jgi:hypothetical protein
LRPRRPSAAMVISMVALLFSLTGGAGAIVGQLTGAQIQRHSITGSDLRPGAVSSLALAVGAVNHINISGGSVHTDDIADGAVTTEKLADGAVTSDKLADGAVTRGKLGSASVVGSSIAGNSVSGADLTAHSVTAADLAREEPITYIGDGGAPAFQHGATQPRSIAQFAVGPNQGKAGYYKDLAGDVHLVGAFNFVPGNTAFVLPPAYRPPVDLTFAGGSLQGSTIIQVGSNGSVAAYPQDSVVGINLGLEDLVLIQDLTWRPDQQGIG